MRVLRWATPVYGLGFLVPLLTSSHLLVTLAMPFIALGGGMIMSLPYAVLIPLMPEDQRGAMTGYYSVSRGVGTWLGPLFGGLAISACSSVVRRHARLSGRVGRVRRGDAAEPDPAAAPVIVPAVVRNKALAVGAEDWLNELPSLVDELAGRWRLRLGRVFDGATEALVLEVTLANGVPAVLKLSLPGYARDELTVLRLADGDGCAKLFHADEALDAAVLERLGRSLFEVGLPLTRRHEILVDAAAAVWRPAPDTGLPTGAAKARRLAEFIPLTWEQTGRPCSEAAVEHALACAARRLAAHDDERAVLVHGDVHQWNALEATDGFKLVDPDGLLAEPEYDLGVIMREDPLELGDPFQRAGWLAERTGLDALAIHEWGVVERVSTGLLCERIGLQPVGRQMLEAADRIAPAKRA